MDRQELHILRTLARWYSSRLLPVSWILSLKFQRGLCDSDQTATTYTVVGPNCCMGREMQRSRRRLCTVYSGLPGRRTRKFKSPSGEGAGCEEGSAKRDRGSVPSRVPTALAHMQDFAGRLAALEVAPVRRLAVRALRCREFLLCRERQAAQRCTKLALCLEQVQGTVAFVSQSKLARSHQTAKCLLTDLSTLPKYLQSWRQFWTNPEMLTGGIVPSGGSRCGNNGDGTHRCSQRRRIRRERGPATERPCPGAAHSAHPSRCPGGYHHGARDGSAGRSDDSSRRILELATSREGALPSSLWSFPNPAKSHRDGRRSPRRGPNRRTRTAARDVLPDPWDTRICSEGQWPRPVVELAAARTVRPRRPTRRPVGHPPKPQSYRLAEGSSRIRVSRETADDTCWKGNAQGRERAPFRRRRQFAKADSR